ncbi:MAG: hypothetical protein ACYDB2_02515 [Acidimicrobiales bacterium]
MDQFRAIISWVVTGVLTLGLATGIVIKNRPTPVAPSSAVSAAPGRSTKLAKTSRHAVVHGRGASSTNHATTGLVGARESSPETTTTTATALPSPPPATPTGGVTSFGSGSGTPPSGGGGGSDDWSGSGTFGTDN